MFKQKKNTVTSGNPAWSMHTPYTSVTGIHSEIQPGANARNSLIQRKISDTMNTVESIHRKDLQSMAFHKKSIENSMLAYTEKVKSITERRPSQPHLAEKRPSLSSNSQETDRQIVRKFSISGTRQELFGKKSVLPPINATRKDNELDNNKLPATDIPFGKAGVNFNAEYSKTYRRKRRFGVYEHPQLMDESNKENRNVRDGATAHIEENVSIAPFPERSKTFLNYVTAHNLDNDPVHRETPAPFIKPGYWSYRLVQQPKKQQPMINTETTSQVRRTKRRPRPIITTPAKPYHQVFTYSSAVQTAILGLGESDLVIDKKKNIFKSRAELQSIDLDDVRMAHSLRSIQECVEPESIPAH
ncbi:hypothetical protein Btru_027349 [Bulinus truncatus]|nr:hypothetical protein Btru_027349 [Bulinus truncatus]